MKLMTYPEEPSIKEKTAFVLQMPDGIDPVSVAQTCAPGSEGGGG
jgi:hypothetical protein